MLRYENGFDEYSAYPDSSIVTWDLQDPNASLFPSYFWITFPALFAGWIFLEKYSKGGTKHG